MRRSRRYWWIRMLDAVSINSQSAPLYTSTTVPTLLHSFQLPPEPDEHAWKRHNKTYISPIREAAYSLATE